jgi:Na+/H+-dicarboxylate symporter
METQARKWRFSLGPLWFQVLAGIILGIGFGLIWPQAGADLKPLGDGFIQLIRMMLAPVIFLTVVVGIARMGDLGKVGRVGLKALIYFEVLSTLALLIGLVAADVLKPGAGMNINPASLDSNSIATYATEATKMNWVSFLMGIIPSSIFDAFARNAMLQIILFSLLFGIGVAQLGAMAEPLIALMDQVLHALFNIVRMIMYVAPIGAFGAMAFTIGKYGIGSLVQLSQLVAAVYLACVIFVVVVLGLVAKLAGFSLYRLMGYIWAEMLIVFSTSSTEAVLPQIMNKLEQLGCERSVVGMVVPAGYTFNADGTAIYLTLAALFVAQATNTPMTLSDQIVVLAVMMLTSKGSAGVAGAGFVTLAATLSAMHTIPLMGIVLLLGVDRFVNAGRATVNLIGNSVATIVIARWENAYDAERAALVLSGGAALSHQ